MSAWTPHLYSWFLCRGGGGLSYHFQYPGQRYNRLPLLLNYMVTTRPLLSNSSQIATHFWLVGNKHAQTGSKIYFHKAYCSLGEGMQTYELDDCGESAPIIIVKNVWMIMQKVELWSPESWIQILTLLVTGSVIFAKCSLLSHVGLFVDHSLPGSSVYRILAQGRAPGLEKIVPTGWQEQINGFLLASKDWDPFWHRGVV